MNDDMFLSVLENPDSGPGIVVDFKMLSGSPNFYVDRL